MAQLQIRSISSHSLRTLALLALAAGLLTIGILSVSADGDDPAAMKKLETAKPATTTLVVDGTGSRSVSYDGTVGRFTISVLRPTVLEAVSVGNTVATAIGESVEENCTPGKPDNADHTAPPTCISPNGLQTTGISIHEEFDWTEAGRVSKGFRYENRLSIALRGTGFAGGLVDLVIKAGGDDVRFDGLDFTASRRGEFQKQAQLDAIDDAQETADLMVDHMGYEIVRIVEITPPQVSGSFRAYGVEVELAAEAMEDSGSYVPTPVFGGSDTVTAQVRMVFEIRPLPEEAEE